MHDEQRRRLLAMVAAGEVSPEEAAALLAGDDRSGTAWPSDPLGSAPGAVPPTAPAPEPSARRVRVEAVAASVRIVGDESVAVVEVDGEHEIEDRGDEVLVRAGTFGTGAAFDRDLVGAGARGRRRTFGDHGPFGGQGPLGEHGPFGPHGPFGADGPFGPHGPFGARHGARFEMHTGRRGGRFAWGDLGRRLSVTVRVNPDLAVDVRVSAGSLDVRGVRAELTVDVDAGAARIRDVCAPVDVRTRAGALTVEGRFDRGDSSVECDMGAATVLVDPDSDVRISARCDLGRCDIRVGDEHHPHEAVVGDGSATLQVRGSLASVSVTVDE